MFVSLRPKKVARRKGNTLLSLSSLRALEVEDFVLSMLMFVMSV
jgi:hypothetical protein